MTTKGPLSKDEIFAAFKQSGFPFELRLLKAFRDGGMDPVFGFRVAPAGELETREVDLLASFDRHTAVDGRALTVSLRLVIEAKSMPSEAAFVGLPWERPTPLELQNGRTYFGGRPSNRVFSSLDRDGDVIIGPGGLAESFAAMNSAPLCVQWAVARRATKGKADMLAANHDPNLWDGLDTVVRAAHALNRGFSEVMVTTDHLRIQYELPVLMLATPALHILDAAQKEWGLTTSTRLVLAGTFQVHQRVEHRLVDVVTEGAVPDFIEACRATADELGNRAELHARGLVDLALRQHEQYQLALVQNAP